MASMMSAARNVSASSAASAVAVTGAVVTGAVVLTAVVGLVAGKATEGGIDFKKNSRLGSFRFDPSAMYSKFPAHRGLGCQPEYYYEGIDVEVDPLEELIGALQDRLDRGAVRHSYNQVWRDLLDLDEYTPKDDKCEWCCAAGELTEAYSEKCWRPGQEQCGVYEAEGDCYNREHTWPHSWWGQYYNVAFTDLHANFPTDGYMNNRRGKSPLGVIDRQHVYYNSSNGSMLGACDLHYRRDYHVPHLDNCFEPPDVHKGRLARVYFYMSLRYRNKFNCCDEVGVDRAVLKPWLRDTLLQWAQEFPVDFVEELRNTRVCGLQKNRNPFVDFPHLTEALVMELSRDAPYFKE